MTISSIIGLGYNPIAFAENFPESVRVKLLSLLRPLGQTPEVAEPLLESYAVISAMGPTYFGFQYSEVEKLANSFGLNQEAARQAKRAMLVGTADLLFASDLPKAQVLDLELYRPEECRPEAKWKDGFRHSSFIHSLSFQRAVRRCRAMVRCRLWLRHQSSICQFPPICASLA